ncbi:MAG: hypothetical protein GY879_09225 [Planctomycetes bacterium]|nr:hypothetical protein [Planctomycetota bacterium]
MKKVEELEGVLFDAVISELSTAPTAGWAQVARGLLSDYRNLESNMPELRTEELKAVLKDAAPFKINQGG